MDRRRRKCNNCSKPGHTDRYCTEPVTSYGVVAYNRGSSGPLFLIIERKNSIAFIEFAYGRYSLDDVEYIRLLFSEMTTGELQMIRRTRSYADIVERVRGTAPRVPPYYGGGRLRFEVLKNGYLTSSGVLVTADALIDSVIRRVTRMSVWELPKGRRLCNESALTCAMRELGEETHIERRYFRMTTEQETLRDEFVSYNGVCYRSVFFVAECTLSRESLAATESDFVQNREVSRIRWVTLSEARRLISKDSLVHLLEYADLMVGEDREPEGPDLC